MALTEKSVASFQELVTLNPENRELDRRLADSQLTYANLLRMVNKLKKSKATLHDCIARYRRLVSSQPNDDIRDEMVGTMIYYSAFCRTIGDLQEASQTISQALSELSQIGNKGTANYQRTAARLKYEYGTVEYYSGDPTASVEHLQTAANILRSLIGSDDEGIYDAGLFLDALMQLAMSLAELEDWTTAISVVNEMVDFAERVCVESGPGYITPTARAKLCQGEVKFLAKTDPEGARSDVYFAIDQWNELLKKFKEYSAYRQYRAEAHVLLAQVLLDDNELDEAEKIIDGTEAKLRPLVQEIQTIYVTSILVDLVATKGRLYGQTKTESRSNHTNS